MPSAEDALTAAVAALSRTSTTAEIESVLHRLSAEPLSAVAKRRLLDDLKRRTRLPIAELRAEMEVHARGIPGRGAPAWHADASLGRDGRLLGNAATILACLRGDRRWHGVVAFDEFHRQAWLRARPPWAEAWAGSQPITDRDEAQILVTLQQQGIDCRIEAVRHALAVRMMDTPFHPIRDNLTRLRWDHRPRLDNAPAYYLGVTPIAGYTELVFAKWMISAVARIFQPGCMAKYCLILEGRQDLRKSMALEILGRPWFTDDIETLGSRDSKLQVNNAWIVELAELDAMSQAEIAAVKAFIARKVDQFRVPFGRHVEAFPRQNVLSGTINPAGSYLQDPTGNVRYWPLACTAIDTDALAADRDQLWAEAMVRYRAGESWWLDEPSPAVTEEQQRRQVTHPWAEIIADWLAGCAMSQVTLAEVMRDALGMTAAEMGRRGYQADAGRCIVAAGWVKAARLRRGAERVWVYTPPG